MANRAVTELCEADGANPNQRLHWSGRSYFEHWLWERYADRARTIIAARDEVDFSASPAPTAQDADDDLTILGAG